MLLFYLSMWPLNCGGKTLIDARLGLVLSRPIGLPHETAFDIKILDLNACLLLLRSSIIAHLILLERLLFKKFYF